MRLLFLLLIQFATFKGALAHEDDSALNVMNFGASGDGKKNDAVAFQNAIDEAAKSGKVLRVPAGKYYIPANASLSIPSGVTIEGRGKASSVIFTDSLYTADQPSLVHISGEDIILKGVGFSGGRPVAADQKSKLTAGRYTLVNISFDTKASERVVIEDCSFSDAHGRGIIFRGRDITIRGCDFKRIGRYNIDFKAVDGAISNFGRNESADIHIIKNSFSYIGTHAISTYRINRVNIEGNVLSHISGIGLANHQCQNLNIRENRIEYTGDNGIDVQRCSQTIISDNFFFAAGNKNAGDAGSAAAIFYGDDYAQGTAVNAVISNNFIRGAFSFNKKNSEAHSQSCGIYVIDAFHVKVTSNNISSIGDVGNPQKLMGIEDGNGIMIVNSEKGRSEDVLVEGNSVSVTKNNGIFVNGQGRDIKVINNAVSSAGGNGIYFSAVATNLFGMIRNNIVTDGRNWFNNDVSADIFVEAVNGWISHLNISGNQLRNNKRLTYKTLKDSVFTTHGIYFSGKGYTKLNNLIVADNQISGHKTDEIGFADIVSSYEVTPGRPFPATGFKNNLSGSTDDQPAVIIPGYHQKHKPWIISESYASSVPEYGNYSQGSVVYNVLNPLERWIAVNSGFATQNVWEKGRQVGLGRTIYVGDQTWRCIKAGRTGSKVFTAQGDTVKDGSVIWELMGKRVMFRKIAAGL